MNSALNVVPTGEALGAQIADIDLTQPLLPDQVGQYERLSSTTAWCFFATSA